MPTGVYLRYAYATYNHVRHVFAMYNHVRLVYDTNTHVRSSLQQQHIAAAYSSSLQQQHTAAAYSSSPVYVNLASLVAIDQKSYSDVTQQSAYTEVNVRNSPQTQWLKSTLQSTADPVNTRQ